MAKRLQAERPYILDLDKEDKIIMHFDMQRSPGGAPQNLYILGFAMIIFGFIPGTMLSAILTGGEQSVFLLFVGWAAAIIIPIIMANVAYKKQGERGSQFTRLIFTRDEVETTSNEVLDRSDIEGAWWRGADTSFSYTNRSSYNTNKAIAESKAEKGNAVGVTYGAKDVMITHHTLNQNQCQKIADAVARWIDDPQRLYDEARGASKQAAA